MPNRVGILQLTATSTPSSRSTPKLMKVRSTATICPALSRMTRPGKEVSLSTTDWSDSGKAIAPSMRDHHLVADKSRPRTCAGDHTKPSVLDVLVVGRKLALPPDTSWMATGAPPFFGSSTKTGKLVWGLPCWKNAGGLKTAAT